MIDYHLRVREPFGTYARGDLIVDHATVASILSGEQHHHVVRVAGSLDAEAVVPVIETPVVAEGA